MVDLAVAVQALAAWMHNLGYQWSVPGDVLRAYDAGPRKSTSTPLAGDNSDILGIFHSGARQRQLKYFWVSSRLETSQVSATVGQINGHSLTAHTIFSLKRPLVSFPSVATGAVQVGTDANGVELVVQSADAAGKSGPGFSFSDSVQTPANFRQGSWAFLQVLTSNDAISQNDHYFDYTLNKEPTLDGSFPYPLVYDPDGRQVPSPAILPTGSQQYIFEDSPADTLGSTKPTALKGEQVVDATFIGSETRDDSYHTYVMFLPPGEDSQWVPVKLVTWNWAAEVNRTLDSNQQPQWNLPSHRDPSALVQPDPTTEPNYHDRWAAGYWRAR